MMLPCTLLLLRDRQAPGAGRARVVAAETSEQELLLAKPTEALPSSFRKLRAGGELEELLRQSRLRVEQEPTATAAVVTQRVQQPVSTQREM